MTQRRIYQNEYPYFVTTVVRDREPAFRDSGLAVHLAETILGACALKSFDVHAWTILPDHVHLLVAKSLHPSFDSRTCDIYSRTHNGVRCVGGSDTTPHTHRGLLRPRVSPTRVFRGDERHSYGLDACATITDLMRTIKGTFAHDLHREAFWQPRFYARITTTERQYRNTLSYILHNRAKHELPERFGRPPHCFSRIEPGNG